MRTLLGSLRARLAAAEDELHLLEARLRAEDPRYAEILYPQPRSMADLAAGLRYAWHHVRLRHLLIFFVGVMLIGFPHVTLVPGLLENELGPGAEL